MSKLYSYTNSKKMQQMPFLKHIKLFGTFDPGNMHNYWYSSLSLELSNV